jgi:hypothetical protein
MSVAYFLWDGSPCRVMLNDQQELVAELHVKGKGFIQIPYQTIASEAVSVNKQRFEKALIKRTITHYSS